MRLVTPLQMREIEAQTNLCGISYDEMMERAGRGLSQHILEFARQRGFQDVLFLCGNGNNAGDCFVAARHLKGLLSIKIALLCGQPKTDLATEKLNFLTDIPILSDQNEIITAVQNAAFLADGVFGIGFHGTLPEPVRHVFQAAAHKPCIAVDIPSGGNGETGEMDEDTLDCVYTVTFGAGKLGAHRPPLSQRCGETICVDIGTPPAVLEAYPLHALTISEIRTISPKRPFDSHKGMLGRLLCVCGSKHMPGAAIMAAGAALRCGVGTLTLASVTETCEKLTAHYPEAMLLPLPAAADGTISETAASTILEYAKGCTAVLIGCGLGNTVHTQNLVEKLLCGLDCPIILDADGLNALAPHIDLLHKASAPIVLTPHPAEMGRLLGIPTADVQKHRIDAVSQIPKRFSNVVVTLKGCGTLTATDKRLTYNPTGNSGMSKGGSGDVLAGMIASLAAQGLTPEDAARIGAFLHGYAGDLAASEFSAAAMLPTDLIAMLPRVFQRLEQDT